MLVLPHIINLHCVQSFETRMIGVLAESFQGMTSFRVALRKSSTRLFFFRRLTQFTFHCVLCEHSNALSLL